MGLFEHDIDHPDAYFDAGLVSIFELGTEGQMVPMTKWDALIHPDDQEGLRHNIQRTWSGEWERGQSDVRIIRCDGDIRHVRANWITQCDSRGRVTHVLGLISDLTDIRMAEENHRAIDNRLAVIAANLPGVLFQADVTDLRAPKLNYVSPQCFALWGYTDEEFYTDVSLFYAAHDPEDHPFFEAALRESVTTGETVAHRYKINRRDGGVRWVDFRGAHTVTNGRVHLEAIILDVTQEVENHEQMEKEREIAFRAQKSESIGLLTGGVAHDFNNLLAVILGNLELLGEESDADIRAELREAAIAATLRGADLTKSLLAFARRARLEPETLDLNVIARESKNWMARALPESVSIETSLLAGVWPIEADRSSLESALLNLILNARDAMGGQGALTIETANVRIDDAYIDSRQVELTPGRYVMLAVSDTGEGIAPANLEAIFEPFFTTKPTGSGSGLGLSMISGFMEQSGGTVQVYSELGEGTTFKLYFPAVDAPDDPTDRQVSRVAPTSVEGERLLVAEDEPAVRDMLLRTLEKAGYDVTAAASGDEAFTVFKADPTFDLLLTDIVMPGTLQGTGLAKELRQIRFDLPVVFMSGYANEATVHGNGLRPEDIRLMKPIQRADLIAAVAMALRS